MLRGKVFTVSGAASGIGRSTAIRLAKIGASGLAISDVNEKGLEETKGTCRQLGAEVKTQRVNVGSADEVNTWIEDTFRHFKRLDGAANVAGVAGGDGTTTVATVVSDSMDEHKRALTISIRTIVTGIAL